MFRVLIINPGSTNIHYSSYLSCIISFLRDLHTQLSLFFFFKQKTAYDMRISDWSSDVCSSDLTPAGFARTPPSDPLTSGPHPAAHSRLRPHHRRWRRYLPGQAGRARSGCRRRLASSPPSLAASADRPRHLPSGPEIGRETDRESVCQVG